MRRALLTSAVLALLAGSLPAAAGAAAPARATPLRAALAACQTGSALTDRFVVFNASMARIKGSERMEMRFDFLQRRPGDEDFVRVSVPKFGVWERAQPKVPAFLVEKRVNALAAPAAYRVLVRFRWFSADGLVLRRAERESGVCKQPDPRPDLVAQAVKTLETNDPQRARYEVVLRNLGRSATQLSTGVVLNVGDAALAPQSVAPLAAGETRTISFSGPRCNGATPLEVSVDPAGVIDEAGERNNLLSVPCAATLERP